MSQMHIIDGALKDPHGYRAAALAGEFRSYDFGHCMFHGINVQPLAGELVKISHFATV